MDRHRVDEVARAGRGYATAHAALEKADARTREAREAFTDALESGTADPDAAEQLAVDVYVQHLHDHRYAHALAVANAMCDALYVGDEDWEVRSADATILVEQARADPMTTP